jgi:hypothetical protein
MRKLAIGSGHNDSELYVLARLDPVPVPVPSLSPGRLGDAKLHVITG